MNLNPLREGQQVFIATPISSDMNEFIKKSSASETFLSDWVKPLLIDSEFKTYLERISHDDNEGFFVRLITSNEIVGVININNIIRGSLQNGFLGFYCFQEYAKRGFMSEGLQLVIGYAFETMKLHRLEANIQPTNHASLAFIQRNHFRKEGYSPNYLMVNGVWEDHERFALTAEDWFKEE